MNILVKADLLANGARNSDFKTCLKFLFTHPGFGCALYYRIYSNLYPKGGLKRALARFLWLRNTGIGCHIGPLAKIAEGLELRHPTGIVIGDGVQIGKNAAIYQNVTIGTKDGESYPVIGDDVTIYAGAVVIGDITIGDGATIGANAVVLKDLPANVTVAGAPAKALKTIKSTQKAS